MWLCTLFEHKSHTEQFVLPQVLRYMVQYWSHWHKAHPTEALPVIIPLVLYHGPENWWVPLNMHALFGQSSIPLQRYVPEC